MRVSSKVEQAVPPTKIHIKGAGLPLRAGALSTSAHGAHVCAVQDRQLGKTALVTGTCGLSAQLISMNVAGQEWDTALHNGQKALQKQSWCQMHRGQNHRKVFMVGWRGR